MIHLRSSVLKGVIRPKKAQDLWPALQHAIELEHSTIPVYLYALYSLDPSVNAGIAAILQSVVVEKMLHMTLTSNVLNALGGSPSIDRPGFIPKYPGPLPAGVQSDLTVHLAPFSMKQLHTFLRIEEREDPIRFRSLQAMKSLPDKITIGEFYTAILSAIELLGNRAFVKPRRNQVGPGVIPESVVVHNVATAKTAIQTIIDQGERTRKSPVVRKGVYAVPTDPSSAKYKPGSAQARANDNFNYTYTSLLSALHAMFNGENTRDQFNRAIGLMMSLKEQAMAMMSGIPNPALFIGPSFEYLRVNATA